MTRPRARAWSGQRRRIRDADRVRADRARRLAAEGRTHAQIAAELGVARSTVTGILSDPRDRVAAMKAAAVLVASGVAQSEAARLLSISRQAVGQAVAAPAAATPDMGRGRVGRPPLGAAARSVRLQIFVTPAVDARLAARAKAAQIKPATLAADMIERALEATTDPTT